ncbi:MAG TPA: hypothetical protein VHX66_12120 [Solirubrobacteraceae bacterium]|jgi:hypothetical protein|nr:hypothetical protein [Solirubrobacteraceae bacterium]
MPSTTTTGRRRRAPAATPLVAGNRELRLAIEKSERAIAKRRADVDAQLQSAVEIVGRAWLLRGWGPAQHVTAYSDQGGGAVIILKSEAIDVQRTPASWIAAAAALVEEGCTELRSRRVAVCDDRGLIVLSFASAAVQSGSERRVSRYQRGRRVASEEVAA